MNRNGVMTPEVSAAAKFISTCLYGKLPRRRADLFGAEFAAAVTRKFQGHWYLETPTKGSAYRCLHFTSKEVDPVFHQAADTAGVPFNEVSGNIPAELRVWIDPGEVSYQIGEKGTVSILYRRNQIGQEEFGHDIIQHTEPVRNVQQQSEHHRLFTVAEFMSTKFGSMKNRGMRRNQMNPNGFRPATPHAGQQFNRNEHVAPQSPAPRQQASQMASTQVHPQQLLLQQQLLIQQLALQNLQLNPSCIDEIQKMQGQQQQHIGVHPLLGHNVPSRSNPIPSYQEHVPDLQLHLNSRGGLKPSFGFNKHHDEGMGLTSTSPLHHGKEFGFKDCWSSSSNRNSPHSDSNTHSGDDSGFDNASLDDDLDLDPLIFNGLASLRLET